MKKATPKKVVFNFSWVSIISIGGVVIMLGLWDSGWKPENAFLAGFMFMLTPGFVFGLYRLWESRERLKMTYEQAKMMFRAATIIKQEKKAKEKK